MYMHHRFTAFREEVLEKLLGANDYWYEWQHRGSAHIHGFIWLPKAPGIGKLQWNDIQLVQNALAYIDKYVSAWNPRSHALRNQMFHRSIVDNPCLMDTSMIVSSDPFIDYCYLANRVQRHTKCTIQTCLRRKGTSLQCRYKAPWNITEKSSLSNDDNGQPKHTPARNDDRLNLHNPFILSIWRANVDCQPVLSIDAVIKYIAKYAAKAENKSETYHAMLSQISTNFESDKPAPNAFRKMLLDNLVDRDIGAQESCHLLLKRPLSLCSRTFFSLNVNQKNFQRVPITSTERTTYPNYIASYMARPIHSERMSLIEVTQKWYFNASRKHDQWKERATLVIVRVSPRFTTIPTKEEKCFQAFCWTELLLYHPFRNIQMDFGSTDDEIQALWERFSHKYKPWHVRRTYTEADERSNPTTPSSDTEQLPENIHNEWQVLSVSYLGLPLHLDELDMLGQRDIDLKNDWGVHHFSPKKKKLLQISYTPIAEHFSPIILQAPLKMIVQGTAGTGKSHLITSIKSALKRSAPNGQSPLLLLAPTGVAAFNIQASTIHSALRIPIKEVHPLQGQTLASFQESMYFIRYIIIDEMSFIGPRLIQRIDIRLREAFPAHNQLPFGGRSIILFGDLGQLPPVKDIPMYASTSYGGTLWRSFITIITLKKIFRQIGDQPAQIAFRALLSNLRNAEPTIADWQLLLSRANSTLSSAEQSLFLSSTHLFATNEMVSLHNKRMLLSLAKPIALSTAEQLKGITCSNPNEEQLESKILLCIGQEVMLSANLWVETGLVNGALGQVKEIVYNGGERPPELPLFVVVQFKKYIGPVWDQHNPKNIPLIPISHGLQRQIPLKMAWALTIHKSQGLTLQRATINIDNTDRQGLTFTAISRVRDLASLRIHPPFTFQRYSRIRKSPYAARADALCDREIPAQPSSAAVWMTAGDTIGSMLICLTEAGCGDGGGGGRVQHGDRTGRGDQGRRGDRGGVGGDGGIRVERVVQQAVEDRGKGGLAIEAGGGWRAGEVIATVGGIDNLRQPTQRRRSDVLPPPVPRIGRGTRGTTTQVPLQIRIPTHREDAQIRSLQLSMHHMQTQLLVHQRQITQLTTERDIVLECLGRAEARADSLERAVTGGSMRDTLREMQYTTKEAEYYWRLYEELVPREHRAPSFAAMRSSQSRKTDSRTESRGVTELTR
ncbi:uncharacterized protein LOC131856900 [Cryptomeria japonica]|uniref:uncharacterized protein LOC131856900 n=1 Tax=Cryptomeria japonica TaxID=3369 RepID=UPI0027D9EEA0|nr:uncharacterized protein LOC131856900 [Cryptomeria japonica]